MNKGIGIDIVGIQRIKDAIKEYGDKFLNKIYTSTEIQYCTKRKALKFPELAARFAAKEAYSKAIGTGMRGIHWKNIEILNEKSGKPYISVKGKKKSKALVSLSHDHENAIAFVIID
ncbi:holo-ACP synthase [Candidatus Margulisiibacteriota bacterium]